MNKRVIKSKKLKNNKEKLHVLKIVTCTSTHSLEINFDALGMISQ